VYIFSQLLTAGPSVLLYTYTMRIYCYTSLADSRTREQLWLCAEWATVLPIGTRFYIREDRLSFALLIDSQMKPVSKFDYIS